MNLYFALEPPIISLEQEKTAGSGDNAEIFVHYQFRIATDLHFEKRIESIIFSICSKIKLNNPSNILFGLQEKKLKADYAVGTGFHPQQPPRTRNDLKALMSPLLDSAFRSINSSELLEFSSAILMSAILSFLQ
jgi:hypothetical protein